MNHTQSIIDPQTPSSVYEEPKLFKKFYLDRPLHYKARIVGRYGIIPETSRGFVIRPIAAIPLRITELGNYLETEYSKFGLKIYEQGEIRFALGPNDELKIVLASISWAYARLLRLPRK